jgi:hypothetical protein
VLAGEKGAGEEEEAVLSFIGADCWTEGKITSISIAASSPTRSAPESPLGLPKDFQRGLPNQMRSLSLDQYESMALLGTLAGAGSMG